MFRIEFFVDDKHLALVMHGLSGKVRDLKWAPVTNAKVKNGKLVAQTNGRLVDQFAVWIKKHGDKPINADTAREFLNAIGNSPTSYNHVLQEAVKLGIIKKNKGKRNGWVRT